MGSVGKNNSLIKGISINVNGTNLRYETINGQVYEVSGTTPRPMPNMTLKDIQTRAESQGVQYQTLTSADLKQRESQRKEERVEANRILNQSYVGDTTFVRGSRASRITNRANKRRKR